MSTDLLQVLTQKAQKSLSLTSNLDGPEVLDWLKAKKVQPNHLIFLKALESEIHWDLLLKCLNQLIKSRASFSETLKNLELCSDLILMGQAEELFVNCDNLTAWSEHLQKLRYPQTTQRDDRLKAKLENLPWPYGSKTKFERRGDRAGIELKLFITSHTDLTKIISSLERVKESLND